MDRPPLRVVTPDERVEPSAPTEPAAKSPSVPVESTKEFHTLQVRVEDTDAARPIVAAYLVCDGCYLADAAISFYHSASAHAPTGTYRHDVPPGLKSAEATRAWLGTHLSDVKKMIADDSQTSYARGKELKQAAVLAATELQRAYATAKDAGLNFDDRYAGLLCDTAEDLAFVHTFRKPVIVEIAEEDAYAIGAHVLGSA